MHIDLHIHTTYSDGTVSPSQNVEIASKMGLTAISIVDHDNTNGLEDAIKTGEKNFLEIVPGVELSAEEMSPQGQELHILGYYIDWKRASFQKRLSSIREARWLRAERILVKLKKAGISLKMDDVLQFSNIQSVGRLHIAKALLNSKHVKNIPDAFEKYLSPGKPAYEAKMRITPKEAIESILELGGVPVVAHPFFGISRDEMLLKELVSYGLKGIEVWHPKHNKSNRQYYRNLADKYKLVATGGSDTHGPMHGRNTNMGSEHVPEKCLDDLKRAAGK